MDGKKNQAIHSKLLYYCLKTNTFFQPPPQSSRPEVIEYLVWHNITGSLRVEPTSETTCVFEGVEVGVYLFILIAYNAIGYGNVAVISVTGEHI